MTEPVIKFEYPDVNYSNTLFINIQNMAFKFKNLFCSVDYQPTFVLKLKFAEYQDFIKKYEKTYEVELIKDVEKFLPPYYISRDDRPYIFDSVSLYNTPSPMTLKLEVDLKNV